MAAMSGDSATEEHQQEQPRQTAAALSLLQRLPPQDLKANLDAFAQISPHFEHALAPYVSRPSQLKRDDEENKYFIACDYNLDGDSHRSPWSNKYFPLPAGDASEDALFHPTERLRRLEETSNEVFDAYKTNYYEGGVSSVYLWELEDGFAGAFLIRKELGSDPKMPCKGVWDSVHVIEMREPPPNSNIAIYKLSSSVMLHMQSAEQDAGAETELAGHITRQAESKPDIRKKVGEDFHLLQIGHMIEEMEISIRQSIDGLYLAKQHEILCAVRSLDAAPVSISDAEPDPEETSGTTADATPSG